MFDVLDDVCDPKYYYIYMFPPPEMKDGCKAFIMDWEEELEKALINRKTNAEVEEHLCNKVTQACRKGAPRHQQPSNRDLHSERR